MSGYEGKFSSDLSAEQQSALIWKIENDYRRANLSARACKDEYIGFAIKFYTRNRYSLEDVLSQYRAHARAEQRRQAASTDATVLAAV